MSSLDRAFFRAYAKEQSPAEPVVVPTDAPASDSPYVSFESSRRPQLRYRIESTHTPWGQSAAAAPHVDVASLSMPDDDEYQLAHAPFESPNSAVWSAQPATLLKPSREIVAPVAPPIVPIAIPIAPAVSRPVSALDVYRDEIVCLSGMDAPESNYLASLAAVDFTIESADYLAADLPTIAPRTSRAAQIAHDEPLPAVLPTPPPAPQPAFAEPEIPAIAVEATTSKADAASLLADDTTACWEVDSYLYPAVTNRLLEEYGYFSQAGQKIKQAAAAGLKVLAITGVGRDEGRSTLAICLARSAAKVGLKVALVDCDFERPQLATQLGLDVASGWQSVAVGKLTAAEVAIRSVSDGITFLPLTEDAAAHSLTLAHEGVSRVIAHTSLAHDVVILDLGPLDLTAIEPSKRTPLDAAIVVWDRRHRTLDEAQSIARRLHASGVEAVGIAENYVAG